MSDRANALTLAWSPETGPARRLVFERAECGYLRIEERYTDGEWTQVGLDRVDSVSVTDDRVPQMEYEQ